MAARPPIEHPAVTETRTVPRILVQTSSSLAATNAGWTTQDWLTCREFSYGAGLVVGYARLEQIIGRVKRPGRQNVESVGPSPNLDYSAPGTLSGLFVRLCLEDSGGTVTDVVPYVNSEGRTIYETVTYAPVWWGKVRGPTRTVDGADDVTGGLATWECAGLADDLDQCVIDDGYAVGADGATVSQLYRSPGFNTDVIVGSGGSGNMSSSTYSVNGATINIFQITNGGAWTGIEACNYILAGFARRNVGGSPYGQAWAISDPLGALTFELPQTEIDGKTVLSVLNDIISPRRGLTWYLTVSGSVPTINVTTTIASAVGGLPGSSSTTTLTVTDSDFLTGVNLVEDDSNTADIITITGERTHSGITLSYVAVGGGSLVDGWSVTEETAWNNDPASAVASNVWRRFVLSGTWNGNNYTGGTGLANDSDGSYSGGVVSPSPLWVSGEAALPSDGVPSGGGRGGTIKPSIYYSGDSGSTWVDLTADVSITVEKEPFAVVLDDGRDGDLIRTLLDSNGTPISGAILLVTVGVRESLPISVEWARSRGDWPASTPRVRHINRSQGAYRFGLERILAGTVLGLSGSSLSTSSGETIRDDRGAMAEELDRAQAAYAYTRYSVRWTDRMRALTASSGTAFQPGFLLTNVITGSETITVNAAIQRRTVRWNQNHWDTIIEAESTPPIQGAAL